MVHQFLLGDSTNAGGDLTSGHSNYPHTNYHLKMSSSPNPIFQSGEITHIFIVMTFSTMKEILEKLLGQIMLVSSREEKYW